VGGRVRAAHALTRMSTQRADTAEALGDTPQPQPEHAEPTIRDPDVSDLSRRDYIAVFKRSVRESMDDHITNFAAALAYYAFLAIPSALLIAVGIFGLVASPQDVGSLVDNLAGIVPGDVQTLITDSLTNMTQKPSTGVVALVVGSVLALWSLSGAMQNLMWALNAAYDREETRGFVRRRLAAFGMLVFAVVGFALLFGVLVLGPHLSGWVGSAVGAETLVKVLWWVVEWPLLVGALLVCFAGLLYFGPNVDHPRWRFLSFGSVVAIVVWLGASGLFALYVSKFGSYNKAWGSLAAVVVLLTWLWLSSVALLFGAEVNAEAERSRELRAGEPAERDLQAPAKA
jgi:membrane protein